MRSRTLVALGLVIFLALASLRGSVPEWSGALNRCPAGASDCLSLFIQTSFDRPNAFGPGTNEQRSSWRYGYDEKRQLWISASTTISRNMREIYLQGPTILSHQELLEPVLEFLAQRGLSGLPDGRAGVAIHLADGSGGLRVFQLLDMSRLKNGASSAYRAQLNLPEAVLDLVLGGYKNRLEIPESIIQRAREISLICMDRSLILAQTREGYIEFDNGLVIAMQEAEPQTTRFGQVSRLAGFTLPERFSLDGALIVVRSSGKHELLPTELLNHFTIDRPDGEVWVEFGRFWVTKLAGASDVSARLIELLSSLFEGEVGGGRIDKIVFEADETHAALFAKWGGRPIREWTRFDGKKDYLIVLDAKEFRARAHEEAQTIGERMARKSREDGLVPPLTRQQEYFDEFIAGFDFGLRIAGGRQPIAFGGGADTRILAGMIDRVMKSDSPEHDKLVLLQAFLSYFLPELPRLIESLARSVAFHWVTFQYGGLQALEQALHERSIRFPEAAIAIKRLFPPNPAEGALLELDIARRQAQVDSRKASEVERVLQYHSALWWPLEGDPGVARVIGRLLDPDRAHQSTKQIWEETVTEMQIWKMQRWGADNLRRPWRP